MSGGTRSRRALSAALVAGCVLLLALAAGPLATLPVLLAFVPLLAGRYLGSETLERLIGARTGTASPPRAPRRIGPPRAATAIVPPRGGALIARSLAERAPPRALTFA
jgi:hypothetical protein